MTSRFRKPIRRAKGVLCILLVLNLQYWSGGCGQAPFAFAEADGWLRVELGPEQPLVQALADGEMAGPTALLVNPGRKTFRLIYPDPLKEMSGSYDSFDGELVMDQLYVTMGGRTTGLDFHVATKQIVSIVSPDGAQWKPKQLLSERGVNSSAPGVEGYLAANAELLSLKADLDSALVPEIIGTTVIVIWAICANYHGCFFYILVLLLVLLFDINSPPIATDDAFTIDENTVLSANILVDNGNGADSDPDGDPLTVSLVTNVTNGTLALDATGAFTYTPNADFVGTDSFVYQDSDGQGGTDNATVTITILNVNNPPIAQDDAFVVDTGVDLNANVLVDNGNGPDTDPDGDPLTVSLVTNVATGTLVLSANGDFTFTSVFLGTVTFVYEISDGQGGTDTATVTIEVLD